MPLWPVAAREARAAARAPRTYAWRAAVTAIGIASIPASLATPQATLTPGYTVFGGIATLAFFYCILGGVLRTADSIAEEKRENTLGLLFLTDLKAGDVITGKLLASSATLFFGLLALLPLLAVPVLIGGVTTQQVVFMIVCLLNSLFFAISCGFLISTVFKQGWITVSVGLAAMLFYCVLLPLLADNLSAIPRSLVRVFSPSYVFSNVANNQFGRDFVQSLAATHLIAWLNILLTAKYLPLFWQERPRSQRAQLWWERLRKIRFGGSTTRKNFRTRLLNTNPLYWLSGREQVSSSGLMALLMFVAALSLVSGWKEVFVGLIVMHSMLLIRMSSAASHALAEDRKSGALELLLATSLRVNEVLKGRWMALGRQFFGPILIVAIWHLFSILWIRVMGDKHDSTKPLLVAMPMLFFAWLTTGAYGMWMGLRARHPLAAIWGTLGMVLLAPWGGFLALFGLLAVFQMLPDFRFESRTSYITLGIWIWGAYLWALRAWTNRRLRAHFREAATDRYSDTQPIDWRPFWRATAKIACVAALVIICVWSARAWINFSGERTLRQRLAAHPDFRIATPPPRYVPADQNLAQWDLLLPMNGGLNAVNRSSGKTNLQSLFFSSIYNHTPLRMWRVGQVHDFLSSGNAPALPKEFDSDIARLRAAAAERPYFLVARPPDPLLGGNFYSLQNWIVFFATRAESRLANKDRPLDDVLLALRFANAMTNEPMSMTSRSHTHALMNVVQPIYDGIRLGAWTDADLAAIEKAFKEIDTFAHYKEWQHYVLRTILTALENPPTVHNPSLYGNIVPFHWGSYERSPSLPGQLRAQQAELIRLGLEEYRRLADPTSRRVDLTPRGQAWRTDRRYYQMLGDYLQLHFRNGALTLAMTQTTIDLVRAACAIERYRLAHNKLPATLEQLTPAYLPKIPTDVMNGAPLIYKPTEQGYLLYSVALDGKDNGGRAELGDIEYDGVMRARRSGQPPSDWVWIYEK